LAVEAPPRVLRFAASGLLAQDGSSRKAAMAQAPWLQALPAYRRRTARRLHKSHPMRAAQRFQRFRNTRHRAARDGPPAHAPRHAGQRRGPWRHGPPPAPAAPRGGEPTPSTPPCCAALPWPLSNAECSRRPTRPHAARTELIARQIAGEIRRRGLDLPVTGSPTCDGRGIQPPVAALDPCHGGFGVS
jgi:hypothetical protein